MRRTSNFLSISEKNLLRIMFLGSRLSSGGPRYFNLSAQILQLVRPDTSTCPPRYFNLSAQILQLVRPDTSTCPPRYFNLSAHTLQLVRPDTIMRYFNLSALTLPDNRSRIDNIPRPDKFWRSS